MRVLLYSFLLLVLISCSQSRIKVSGSIDYSQLDVTLLLRFLKQKSSANWVCYAEVKRHKLQAVSCQNDTALPLFSAGLNNSGQFEYNYLSRRLLMASPENTVAYIKMALYTDFTVNSNHINIKNRDQLMIIEDKNNKLTIQVSRI